MGDIEPGYTVLVKKPTDVEVGQKVRLVGETTIKTLKKAGHDMKDERMATVQSIGEKSIDVGMGDMPVPARADRGLKFKFYRTAKKKGRTAKKKEGGRRRTLRK
jgi:hypothetical protein